MVQRELARRTPGRSRHSGVHLFSGRIVCGVCGSTFGSKVWHSNSKYRRVIWQCNHKYEGDEVCGNTHLTDTQVEEAFLSAVNKLLENRDTIHRDFQKIKKKLYSTAGLEKERVSLEEEMNVASGLIDQLIAENARKAQDQAEYQRRYDELVSRFEAAKNNLAQVASEIERRTLVRETIETFLTDLEKQDKAITSFDEETFCSLVDHITVYGADDIRATFKNGSEIKA
ncbi:zinc ribbon domain-containing protein [Olsenella sp. HMSC062G07]|uniref:zinc ribbon domain-containing protein n=1 Tax=Olsenella sp. HMSC062G07 TaxID=1739330 RepID=UPI002112A015|nr:recombinase zinc beta ribbon domain-containing protein [Olsenella sp. HMSC062G07]